MARKSPSRKTKESRHILSPQKNIIENGTITRYSPHTIDTTMRKNTVIKKTDLAIVTKKKQVIETVTTEQKPRLIHLITRKTEGEYKRNQEKKRKLLFRRN